MKGNLQKAFLLQILLLLLLLLPGCGQNGDSLEVGGKLYFLNTEETQIVSEAYEAKGTFKEALVQEYVEALRTEPDHRGYKRLLPDNVTILDYSFGNAEQLILNFDSNYSSFSGITEILIRAAIVKTFCQIDGIDYVEFYVNGIPYMIGEMPVGLMKGDDFIDDTGEQSEYSQFANLSIYFANEEGTGLLLSHRQVSYNVNISMEQLVIEQLLAGPIEAEQEAGMRLAMPAGTELIRVNTRDGVCYLDLNEKFLEKPEGLKEEVIVYAVVNSLVELPYVNKVQIRINGEIGKGYQNLNFSDMFERNLDLIETEN